MIQPQTWSLWGKTPTDPNEMHGKAQTWRALVELDEKRLSVNLSLHPHQPVVQKEKGQRGDRVCFCHISCEIT